MASAAVPDTGSMDHIYTAAEVDRWTAAADLFFERAIRDFDPPLDVEGIVGMWMDTWRYEEAPIHVLTMANRLVQAGYVLALKDVAHGTYDSELSMWRPDLCG